MKKLPLAILLCVSLTGLNNYTPEIHTTNNHFLFNDVKDDSIPCFVTFNVSKQYKHNVDLSFGSGCSIQHKKETESSDISYQLNNYRTFGTSFQATGFGVEIAGENLPSVTGNLTYSRTRNITSGCCPSGTETEDITANGSSGITVNSDEGQVFYFQYDYDTKQGNCAFSIHSLRNTNYNSAMKHKDCRGEANDADLSSMGPMVLQGITLAGLQLNNMDNPMNDQMEQMGIGGKCEFTQMASGYTLSFSSTHTTQNPLSEGWTGTDDITYTLHVNVTINFHQKYLAYIEPDGGWESYKKWLPEGNIKDDSRKKGNSTSFKIKMIDNDHPNEEADVQIKEVTFSLLEVTHVPGVCNNYPTKDPDQKSDFGFLDPNNEENTELLELKFNYLNPAKINSYDFGGSAKLTAKITLKSGEEIIAESSEDHKKYVNIPYRKDDSKVSDDWKQQNNASDLADNDDNEKSEQNIGANYPGDGYTLYEEYRGFRENEKHIRTSPKNRDLMILDNSTSKDRTQNGIMLFSTVSDIITHSKFKEEEFGEDKEEPGLRDSAAVYHNPGIKHNKIMNFNNDASLHGVDQHGLLIISSPDTLGYALAKKKSTFPATPKGFFFLVITEDFNPNTGNDTGYSYIRGDIDSTGKITINPNGRALIITDEYASTVAHEMFHCCHVMHHGDTDYKDVIVYPFENKIWLKKSNGEKFPVTFRLNDSAGTEIRAGHENFWASTDHRLEFTEVGLHGGQHSGVEDCIMRYNNADAFLTEDKLTLYWLVLGNMDDLGHMRHRFRPSHLYQELTGIGLCDKKEGTGVNEQNASPRCRYGDATEGNCKSQLCINDKYD